jgi:hypothetical protein
MKLAENIGWVIFGLMYMPWVFGEAIRLLAPKYHARMLARIKEGRI